MKHSMCCETWSTGSRNSNTRLGRAVLFGSRSRPGPLSSRLLPVLRAPPGRIRGGCAFRNSHLTARRILKYNPPISCRRHCEQDKSDNRTVDDPSGNRPSVNVTAQCSTPSIQPYPAIVGSLYAWHDWHARTFGSPETEPISVHDIRGSRTLAREFRLLGLSRRFRGFG
ncbi:hypothetical protein BJ546DRAFT_136625 [Cryomyces antarcticus]